jgi:hypothetical protein
MAMDTTAQAGTAAAGPKSEIKIVSHSGLFYWWPVWAVGYVMAILTYFSDHFMATVPRNTYLGVKATGELTFEEPLKGLNRKTDQLKKQDILIAPQGKELREPRLHMSQSKNPGVLFCTVLLLVIVITNIPLRGLWSVIVIILIILLSVILALMGVWDTILQHIGFLDIRINMAGYVVISTVLLAVWLVAFFLFDQQVYMIFTPGQFRVRQEIGAGEMAHDTTGMTVQKQRSDLFRHWILGLGSGDLIVRTSGAHPMQFDLPNVLFLGRKVKEIEEMLRTRQVAAAQQV